MQINYKGGKNFIIKTKTAVIQTDPIKINEMELEGPGEYEISDVMVEGIALGEDKIIYLLKTEDVNILHLDSLDRPLTSEELEKVSSTDILFLPLVAGEETKGKVYDQLISQIDPRIVIPMGNIDSIVIEKMAGTVETVPNLKITQATLPEAERRTYIIETS